MNYYPSIMAPSSSSSSSNNPSSSQQQQQQQQQQIKISEYGKYDASTVKNQYWLARLPNKLFELWDDLPEGTVLGHLTFTKGTPSTAGSRVKTQQGINNSNSNNKTISNKNPQVIQQKLALQVKEDIIPPSNQSDLPLDYTLTNLTTKIPTLHPFSRGENGKVDIHGTISRSCNLQMERTERYREMCKLRLLNAVAGGNGKNSSTNNGGGRGSDGTGARFVKPVQNSDLIRTNNNVGAIGSGFGNSIAKFGKKLLDAKNEMELYGTVGGELSGRKRKFDDNQSVRSILFELFSQEEYWSVKELIRASGGRSEKEIRAELKLIAESMRTGEFKGLWKLKTEYGGKANNSKTTADG